MHGKKVVSQLQYEPVKLFGLLPGMPSAHLPPWLVAYLVLTIPLLFALRALLRIH